jgi:hypothetical protein
MAYREEEKEEGRRKKRITEGRFLDVSWTRRASPLLMDDERVVRLPKGHSLEGLRSSIVNAPTTTHTHRPVTKKKSM